MNAIITRPGQITRLQIHESSINSLLDTKIERNGWIPLPEDSSTWLAATNTKCWVRNGLNFNTIFFTITTKTTTNPINK